MFKIKTSLNSVLLVGFSVAAIYLFVSTTLNHGQAVKSQTTDIITRISVDSSGTQGDNASTRNSIDDDGSHIAFTSAATNLVDSDANSASDIFVYATATGQTTLVSKSSSGTIGNNDSDFPAISADGDVIAFQSSATNLVTSDTNSVVDIFVHVISSGVTERVSIDDSGTAGNDHSLYPSISDDGRYVAFQSAATNLVASDTNGVIDVFVYDRTNNTIERVSVDTSETESNGHSIYPAISDDGRYVAFSSVATNLVGSDTNSVSDVFVRDTTLGTTVRVSIDSSGTEANGLSSQPSISSDGRYVAFESEATNLISSDSNSARDIFLRDTHQNVTERVSVATGGTELNNFSGDSVDHPNGRISSNGQYIVFKSYATNAVSSDSNALVDVFVHDRQAFTTTRVSTDSLGTEANNVSYYPSISGDGKYIGFYSYATNLVANDTNGAGDVFVYNRDALTPTSTPTPSDTPTPTPTPYPITVSVAEDVNNPTETSISSSAGTVYLRCEKVFHGGAITVYVLSSPPSNINENFTLLPTNFDVSASDLICGKTTLCLPYSEDEVSEVGLTESELRLLHYWDGNWNDVTTSVDVLNNQVCGGISSFSPFAIGTYTGDLAQQNVATPTTSAGGATQALPKSGVVEDTFFFILVSLMTISVGGYFLRFKGWD